MVNDAYMAVSGAMHNLLPHLQNAVDRVLNARSPNYWNSIILPSLKKIDRDDWMHNGIYAVQKLDLQALLKVIDGNHDIFKAACGTGFDSNDWYEVKLVRNAYCHASGSISFGQGVNDLAIIRKLAEWLKVPTLALQEFDELAVELKNGRIPSEISIRLCPCAVEGCSNCVMTQHCYSKICGFDQSVRLAIEKGIAEFYGNPSAVSIVKRRAHLYTAELPEKLSAVLYETPASEYVFVDVVKTSEIEQWVLYHAVLFDAKTGQLTLTKMIDSGAPRTSWTSMSPEEAMSMPDHGGGAISYVPVADATITFKDTLSRNPSRRSAFCVLDAELYKKMMDGTLEDWQIYLHPDQLQAVEMDSNGPSMVRGTAGTGKTVVLVHRVKWLLENKFKGAERILITTFNKSLEYSIGEMLGKICSVEQLKRIDIVYFDQMLGKMWKVIGGKKIFYKKSEIESEDNLFRLKMRVALMLTKSHVDVDMNWLEREYDTVIQEYALRKEEDYLSAVRPRIYGSLKREDRHKYWDLFVKANGDPFALEVSPAPCSTRMRVINHVTKALLIGKLDSWRRYSAVLVDESQNMGAAEYRLFAAMTGNGQEGEHPNSLTFAGDGHQRIYHRMGSLISCGINVRGGRTVTLKKCYRSTGAIKQYAEEVLKGVESSDMDAVDESFAGSEAVIEGVGPEERFRPRESYDVYYEHIAKTISRWMSMSEQKRYSDYAVLLRDGHYRWDKTWRLKKVVQGLEHNKIPAVVIDGRESYSTKDAVRVMTMHRANGMQFRGVVVDLLGWPREQEDVHEESAVAANLIDEKKLLYVAITRALKHVLLTGVCKRPKILPPLGLK